MNLITKPILTVFLSLISMYVFAWPPVQVAYRDSLQLLRSNVIHKIETEQTVDALDDVLKIEHIIENHPEFSTSEFIAINYYIKGLSAYNFLDYDEALKQADNAILNASESNDAVIKSLAEHIKALALYGLNEYPNAEEHFRKALEHLDESYGNETVFSQSRDAFKVDNYYYIAILNYSPTLQWFNDAGKFLDRSQKEILETAIANAEESLKYISFSNKKIDKRFPMYLLIADSYLKLNRSEDAKKYLAAATNYLQNNSVTLLRHYWFNRCYAEFYEASQDYEQSMMFYKRALELIRKYSLNVNNEFKQTNKSNINYMTNQLSVSLMKTEKELTDTREEKGMALNALILIVIATLIAIVIYLWRLVKLKNSKNKQLVIDNSELNKSQ